MEKTSSSQLRKRILKNRKVELSKHTKAPVTYDEAPSIIDKTNLMKYVELKHGGKIEELLYPGSIYEVAKRLGIDYSTVSKWRKLVEDAKFFAQFENNDYKRDNLGETIKKEE